MSSNDDIVNEESMPETGAMHGLNAVPADVDDVPGLRQSAYVHSVLLIILLPELNFSCIFEKACVKIVFLWIFALSTYISRTLK